MMTVLRCIDYGVTDIMVVHDSFATTIGGTRMPGDVKRLSNCTRLLPLQRRAGYTTSL